MSYLTDEEKRILFSALSRERIICEKLDDSSGEQENRVQLTPIVRSLERKFYYDRFEKEIRNKAIEEFVCKLEKHEQDCDKLAEYEDLEEQGLLLRVSCKVGDIVYIPYSRPKYIKKAVVKEFLFDGVDFHIQTDFVTFSLRDVNTTVFLTQSEAEEKLRELEEMYGTRNNRT